MSDTLKSYNMRIKSNLSKNWTIYTLFIIIILASFLRLYNLDNLNVIEDTEANKIIGMLHVWNTSPGNIFAQFSNSIPFGVAITELLLSLSAHFLGFSIFSVRLPLAIVGVLIVISVYFLGKELYDERVGLLSAFLLAISPLHIWYTRMIIHHNVTALFIVLALYFFIKNEHTSKTYQSRRDWITKNKYLLLTVLMIWLGCCNEEPILGVLPVFLLYLLFTQKLGWIKRKELWVGFIILLLPALIFGGSAIRFIHGHVANRFEYFWDIVYHGDFIAWKEYIINWSLERFELLPFYRFHLPLISALVFFSLIWLIIRHKKSELCLLFSIAVFGIFFTLYPEKHEYYMVHYIPMVIVALGGFIVYLINISERPSMNRPSILKPIVIAILVIGIIISTPVTYSTVTSEPTILAHGICIPNYPLIPPNPETLQRAYASGHGMEEVADAIMEEAEGKDVMLGDPFVWISKPAYIYLYTIASPRQTIFYYKDGLERYADIINNLDYITKTENEWLNNRNNTLFWIAFTRHGFETDILHKIHSNITLVKTVRYKGKPYFYVYRIFSIKESPRIQEFYCIYKTEPEIQYPIKANYSNKILFLGYNLNYKNNCTFLITYYWKSLQKVNKDYIAFVHITDKNGKIVFQQDHEPAYGEYPTSNWKLGEIIKEDYYVVVPSDVLPGTYDIRVGLYLKEEGKRLPIINKEVSDGEDRAIIGNIEVLPKNE